MRITSEGQACRHCGHPVEKRIPKAKSPKQQKRLAKRAQRGTPQTYAYKWYLRCPNCKAMYMVESAKYMLDGSPVRLQSWPSMSFCQCGHYGGQHRKDAKCTNCSCQQFTFSELDAIGV